jgi:hypothetical protein
MNFTIDESFITDVHVSKQWGMYDHIHVDDLTPEQLFTILKGEDRYGTSTSIDHPEFTKLRNELEEKGYIRTQRNWWNGDTVLKSFTLNGWKFKKNHRFPCAGAMRISIKCARAHGWKSISSF